jgi:hypothetical protein
MASSRPRSAALLISVYLDAECGAAWFARLEGFDDPLSPELHTELATDKEELLSDVRRWLDDVLRNS